MHVRQAIGILAAVLITTTTSAQLLRGPLPGRSIGAQYAGSIGLVSVSAMRHNTSEKIGVGLSFGHVPRTHGGALNTWTLRGMYTPWRIDLTDRLSWQPLQTGLFIAYTTGLDLKSSWPSYLERGYYWWSPNFRQHLYVRSQLGWRTATSQRIAAYFEMNTNDLYVFSWWPNRKSIPVMDIVFFGVGVQYYFKPFGPKDRASALSTGCAALRKMK